MNIIREYVAYRGRAFTIEWYFDEEGKSQPLDYFCSLSTDRQDSALMLFKRFGDNGKIFDERKFRSEGELQKANTTRNLLCLKKSTYPPTNEL